MSPKVTAKVTTSGVPPAGPTRDEMIALAGVLRERITARMDDGIGNDDKPMGKARKRKGGGGKRKKDSGAAKVKRERTDDEKALIKKQRDQMRADRAAGREERQKQDIKGSGVYSKQWADARLGVGKPINKRTLQFREGRLVKAIHKRDVTESRFELTIHASAQQLAKWNQEMSPWWGISPEDGKAVRRQLARFMRKRGGSGSE